jgi:hypothetical protein
MTVSQSLCRARLAASPHDPIRKPGAEFVRPPPDRFMADDHASLEQQLLQVAKAELKAEIPSNGVADDRRLEPVAAI